MKKTLFASLLFVAIALSACKPEPEPENNGGENNQQTEEQIDGIYSPVKKISKIYRDQGDGKYLSESWTWDKNQLKRIDYYCEDNTVCSEEYFTYNEKGQLTRIECFTDDIYTEYVYSNDKLSKAKVFADNELLEEWRFTHNDDNKISKLELIFESKSSNPRIKSNVLSMILPNEAVDYIQQMKNNNASPMRSSLLMELTWDNDNISEIETTEDGTRSIVEFKYDNKLNPYLNYLGLYVEQYYDYGSKNNVTQMMVSYSEDGESYNEVEKFSYSYDGDYPIVKKTEMNGVYYYEY